jgi:hypothetical protein
MPQARICLTNLGLSFDFLARIEQALEAQAGGLLTRLWYRLYVK